ncbi:hypothetical protein [Nocardia sp. NPDC052566]|uniref:hypothetical protein n=1 Tax=Nocardia sp. NPDC052566 TaxID=3364330 RepID=UPI0037CB9F28
MAVGAGVNPHGHGFGVIVGDRIITGHGMDAAAVIDRFVAVRHQYPQWSALFHSRFATHGARDVTNCHPFPLGADTRTVLAHNGILPKRVHPRPYDPRSDTRIAAEDYLPNGPFGSIDTYRGARGLSSWLGSSKLVILTVDPAYRYSAYLFGEQAGQWSEGIWYSNTSYLSPSSRGLARHRQYLCGGCQALDLDRTGRYCARCGWCFECATAFPHCDCVDHVAASTSFGSTSGEDLSPLLPR